MSRKISELLKSKEKFTYSLEVTPDITEDKLENLKLEPLFFSITWHAQSHQCSSLEIPPIKLAKQLRNKGKNVLLHLTCEMMTTDYADSLLKHLQMADICNLFVVLGEKFDPSSSDFRSTKDLVNYIRLQTGDYFCIGVAGFPGFDDKLLALKEKVDCGVDFILTQATFEYDIYKKFMLKCKMSGITIPVLPGIFPFETDTELNSFIKICKVHVSENFMDFLKKENEMTIILKILGSIITDADIKHFHFFTMNKISRSANIIMKLCETFTQ